MRLILISYVIFTAQVLIKAQGICDGFYVNEESKEFICFYNDTMQFRIYNYDAFGTFSIGYGRYEVDNKGHYHVLQCNSIIEQTSIVKQYQRNDSLLVIKVIHSDGMPVISASIYLNDLIAQNNSPICVGISDKSGQVTLSEKQVNSYVNKETFILIEALGFSTGKIAMLKTGYDYVIQSIMPETYPFIVFCSGKLIIKNLNDQEINVMIWRGGRERRRYGESKLRKIDIDFQCSQFLFDKDIPNLHY
jgi:hypothetical protein